MTEDREQDLLAKLRDQAARIAELEALLGQALLELEEHNSEYHHVTEADFLVKLKRCRPAS